MVGGGREGGPRYKDNGILVLLIAGHVSVDKTQLRSWKHPSQHPKQAVPLLLCGPGLWEEPLLLVP